VGTSPNYNATKVLHRKAATALRLAHPSVKFSVWELDMSSYASIQSFAL
jgi:hypothetical protein